MLKNVLISLYSALFLMSCNPPTEAKQEIGLKTGTWRVTLDLGEALLPFNLQVYEDQGDLLADVINAEERITIKDIRYSGDSIYMRMPLFDSEFQGIIDSIGDIHGLWRNFDRVDYALPFIAKHDMIYRFCESNQGVAPPELKGKFDVRFSPDLEEDEYPAIGQFETSGTNNRVTGTFMTETGDYRFLEGNFCDGKLFLSCFDGSHAFCFEAELRGDSLINGVFRSGKHWKEPWAGVKHENPQLTDPHQLTQIVDSSAMNGLQFPASDGSVYTIKDESTMGKVTIIQLMGSWCPNCIDETMVYKDLYDKYHDEGLDIVPIAFESEREAESALVITDRLRERLNLPYQIYYGGYRSKKEAQERLPFLNKVSSFPTSIVIDKNGQVRDVHTGFYGPGTKSYYSEYVRETEEMVLALLNE